MSRAETFAINASRALFVSFVAGVVTLGALMFAGETVWRFHNFVTSDAGISTALFLTFFVAAVAGTATVSSPVRRLLVLAAWPLGLVFIAAVVWWLAYSFFYAPRRLASGRSRIVSPAPQVLGPRGAVRRTLAAVLPGSEPRLELFEGENLTIYVPSETFEAIPFPDRTSAVQKIGNCWCERVEHTFLPTVRIRDIRTGKNLAEFSCTTGRASLKDSQ
jgi:hypothetical protein